MNAVALRGGRREIAKVVEAAFAHRNHAAWLSSSRSSSRCGAVEACRMMRVHAGSAPQDAADERRPARPPARELARSAPVTIWRRTPACGARAITCVTVRRESCHASDSSRYRSDPGSRCKPRCDIFDRHPSAYRDICRRDHVASQPVFCCSCCPRRRPGPGRRRPAGADLYAYQTEDSNSLANLIQNLSQPGKERHGGQRLALSPGARRNTGSANCRASGMPREAEAAFSRLHRSSSSRCSSKDVKSVEALALQSACYSGSPDLKSWRRCCCARARPIACKPRSKLAPRNPRVAAADRPCRTWRTRSRAPPRASSAYCRN